MADPRSNVSALRGLGGIGKPPKPNAPAPAKDGEDDPGSSDATPVSQAAAQRPAPVDTASSPPPPPTAPAARTSRSRSPQRKSRRASAGESSVGGSDRRDVPTTVYLPKATRERMREARQQTRMSAVDVILDAIHTEWKAVKGDEGIGGPAPARDPDLELPVARRPRRQVDDGAPVQIRLTRTEKDKLTSLAADSGVSLSELVTTCVDRRWDQPESPTGA